MNKRLSIWMMILVIASCSPRIREFKKSIKHHRNEYKKEFINEERAPLKTEAEVMLLDFYPPDIDYRCDCQIFVSQEKIAFEMPTYSGISKPFYIYAIATCPLKGKTIKLQLYQSIKQGFAVDMNNLLFLPFKDATNDETSYGGGRYIDLKLEDINDGRLVIDFNKCYNPWCAYSDGYNCPIPPRANHLDIKIEAGERMYKGAKKE